MAAPAVGNPVLIPPPAQPHDNGVIVPAPAAFPPTRDDILAALRFRQDVGVSIGEYGTCSPAFTSISFQLKNPRP